MAEYIFAAQQGRKIPKEDKNFSVNNRAKAMIAEKGKDAVVNSTLGVLLDEKMSQNSLMKFQKIN